MKFHLNAVPMDPPELSAFYIPTIGNNNMADARTYEVGLILYDAGRAAL
jgi:hypothetical protein